MDNRSLLYNEIKKSFLDRSFLHAEKIGKEEIAAKDTAFRDLAKDIIDSSGEESRVNSATVIKAAVRHFHELENAPESGWQNYCYRYILNILFPHLEALSEGEEFRQGRNIVLRLLRGVYNYERKALRFDPAYDFAMLSESEVKSRSFTEEYISMKKLVNSKYIYEFMRLGSDTSPYNTLGHVAGVHYVAMFVAHQLYDAGIPVDLALMSGAAASHDIGKYGCRKHEEKRVPYLHYYYTNYCMNRFGFPAIAHIAANHSTWDLELDNLSVESLLLIYADFRVKSSKAPDGREIIHFYSLADAFDVILGKLDNVDDAKKHRYTKVYAKLKDFEDYMIEHGVVTELSDELKLIDGVVTELPPEGNGYRKDKPLPIKREIQLLEGEDIINRLKHHAVDHNIRLMSRFNKQRDFVSLVEEARSETNRKNLRTYISIFGDYSTYMTEEQKALVLQFLYERLSNRESDIREQSARQMGQMIANYREAYKKDLPDDIPKPDVTTTNLEMFEYYLSRYTSPSESLADQHRRWIMQSTDFFVKAVISNCRESWRYRYLEILSEYFLSPDYEEMNMFMLISTALSLEKELCTEDFLKIIRNFAEEALGKSTPSVDLLILDLIENFFSEESERCKALRRKIMGVDDENITKDELLSSMFLNDLKFKTRWTDKLANIRYMMDTLDDPTGSTALHIATHFVNLIKVSETVTVRKEAGAALLELVSGMSLDQRNEIMVELFNGLEIEDYQFSRFIPDFLGIVILYLPPKEYDEVIDELESHLNAGNDRTTSAALITLSIALENYDTYAFRQTEAERYARRSRLMGLLMKGFAYFDEQISREAFRTIGEHIFGSEKLTLEEKHDITKHIAKRMMTIVEEHSGEQSPLEFYNNAAVLNTIYRFISEYISEVGSFRFDIKNKVAFFPGTFDPFSRGHKAIAQTIRNVGFEVYLALDEFSWSKKTLPHMLRRNILRMSVADEENICVFPDDISINIANPTDLAYLKKLFEGKEIYIAVGSDVVENASSYKTAPAENSIHEFNHIIFARESRKRNASGKSYPIEGKTINLKLKKFYEDISSTRIRENIDLGRDISTLLDPIVQNYIYENNFYSRQPAYKHELKAMRMNISTLQHENGDRIEEIKGELTGRGCNFNILKDYLSRPKVKTIYIETGVKSKKISAFAAAHKVETYELLNEFKDKQLAAEIRATAGGAVAVIAAVYAGSEKHIYEYGPIVLTEILTALLARDYKYVVFNPIDSRSINPAITEILKRHGFVNISTDPGKHIYAADMSAPIVLFRDVETVIKAPLNKNPRVLKVLNESHAKLLKTFTDLYPGKLIVSFDTSAVYSRIVDLVVKENSVSAEPDHSMKKGPFMAVPFGKALSDVVVPNTVTKALRTEKYFNNSIIGFSIREAKGYSTLEDQAKTLESFGRPVILIDDLLHSGQRMNKIDPILRNAKVNVRKVIVGLLTGDAMDDMNMKARPVEGAYFIPTIDMWLNERDCYPFIGGDSIDSPDGDSAASINLILPYTTFNFVGRRDQAKVYKYSMTCLENARDIMRVLENEYQILFERKLTLKRLGDVITYPRRPDYGAGIEMDESASPSKFIENDIIRAKRLNLKSRKQSIELSCSIK